MNAEDDIKDPELLKTHLQRVKPQYLTVEECRIICRFHTASTIRKAVYKGEMRATRITANKLLINSKDFWAWFHKHDVKPPPETIVHIDLHEPTPTPEEEPYALERFE